jgi:hypothetical protein
MMYSIDRKQPLLGAVCLAVALTGLAGCSMGTMQMSGPFASPAGSVTISGSVHGGQQPILNSAIQLWVAGSGSYGAGASKLISSSVTSGSTGNFSITGDYTCPSATSLVYLTATGGNPGLASGTNNTAIELASPLGACGNLNSSTFLVVNEVTTAATAFALGQYFTPTFGSTTADSFGAPGTTQAQLGITNAFATAANLVSINSGIANASLTLTGAAGTITAVPEATKLNTIADILASCVDSLGASDPNGNCTTLFADSAPTGSTAPTDTLQAAVYLSLNPTSTNAHSSATNIAALYGLAQGTGAPYSGVATQPTDWTIGIQYQDGTGALFLKPQNLAVDGYGNVWVLSNNGGLGSLIQLSPSGKPISNIASLSENSPYTSPVADPPAVTSPKTTTTTFGSGNYVFATTFGAASSNPSINPRNLAIDPSNNVWFTTSSGATSTTGGPSGTTSVTDSSAIFEVATTGGLPTGSSYGFSTGKSGYGLAIDGAGDVFVGNQSSSAYFELFEFPYNATPGNAFLTPIAYPIATATAGTAGTTGSNTYIEPEYMAFDTAGNLWMDSGSGTGNTFTVELSNIGSTGGIVGTGGTACTSPLTTDSVCDVPTSTTENTFTTYSLTGSPTDVWGLAAGASDMYIPAGGGSGLNVVPDSAPSSNTFVGTSATFTLPHYLAVDGAGNVWVADNNGTPGGTNATAGGSISESSSTGTILSPSTSSTTTVNPGFVHAGLNFGAGTAIDPSGNVWVANNAAYASGTPSSVFELVGAAAPTVTPIAQALSSSKVGAKP